MCLQSPMTVFIYVKKSFLPPDKSKPERGGWGQERRRRRGRGGMRGASTGKAGLTHLTEICPRPPSARALPGLGRISGPAPPGILAGAGRLSNKPLKDGAIILRDYSFILSFECLRNAIHICNFHSTPRALQQRAPHLQNRF